MFSVALVASLILAPRPATPKEHGPVEIVRTAQGQFVVRAQCLIEDVQLLNLPGRYDYFVDFASDRREVRVDVRSQEPHLQVVVETRRPGTGMPERFEFIIRNPAVRR